MQTNISDNGIQRGPLLTSQIVIYALIAVGTVVALWPVFSPVWHKPTASQLRQEEGQPDSNPKKPVLALADEVQETADRWKKDGLTWTLQGSPSGMYDMILPVDMRGLESADLSAYRKAAAGNWQGVETLPTLAGMYNIRRVAASPWPRSGSAAIELTPAMNTDPEQPARPWRVVLFFAATKDATTHTRQAVANAGSNYGEQMNLGCAALTTLAVPLDRQNVNGLVTYYCVCPTQATLQIAGVKLSQTLAQNGGTADVATKRYAAWSDSYSSFVAIIRQRDQAATTPEQHQQIKNDVLEWKANNPEPPRPPGYEATP